MEVEIFEKTEEMGAAAAAVGIAKLKEVLDEKGSASIIVATGVSQFDLLAILAESDLPWNKITAFHLDEYVGLPITHGASFRKYLWERFVTQLPLPPAAFHFLDGEGEVEAECERVSELIAATSIDVAFVGIGENGHLA
ncbi:MAG: 6-phosphogluconolactonase, partial [Opitutales bacterium]